MELFRSGPPAQTLSSSQPSPVERLVCQLGSCSATVLVVLEIGKDQKNHTYIKISIHTYIHEWHPKVKTEGVFHCTGVTRREGGREGRRKGGREGGKRGGIPLYVRVTLFV